ncbi:ionotropic receptor 21a-like [Palaemon carinicauda]|uniref:ionotropic receptor 21a-like n=1 Tax=Palaemon carinicauda TaxID=392227 RepID=UPI0035B57D14
MGVLRQSVSLQSTGRAWQRVWLASWWAGCIIISTAYTGNLIAFLTVPAYPSRVETVPQLAKSDLRVTMQDYGEFVPEALKKSSDRDFYTIGHKMDLFAVEDTLGLHYQKGVDGVMARTHALLETYSYLMNVQVVHDVLKETYLMKEQIINLKSTQEFTVIAFQVSIWSIFNQTIILISNVSL